jgi:parallel beta-helix repeat protein
MLCPNCLQTVDQFDEKLQRDNSLTLTCPQCNETVPVRYRDDYDRYPPVVFSIVGFRAHGKTVFFSSLLFELDRLGRSNRAFSYTPLDEAGLKTVRDAQNALEHGHLPEWTRKLFPKPAILQLEGMDDPRGFRLLMYDTGGEVFENVAELKQYGGYVSRGRSTVWLISLSKLKEEQRSPRDLDDFVTRYVQAVRELGGNPSDQVLLIVLTMGDRLLEHDDLPAMTRDFLSGVLPTTPTRDRVDVALLEQLSCEIEAWLEAKPGHQNFVRRARREFAEVRYCAISALGSQPEGQTQTVSLAPRGVLVPLQWVRHFERERQELQESVMGLETNLAGRSAMINTYLGTAVSTKLLSDIQGAKQTAEKGPIEQARERILAIESEVARSLRRVQMKRLGRYLTVILMVGVVISGLGWLGWRQWLKAQRKEGWYIRENIAELMTEGGVLELPAGDYQLSTPIVLHKPLSLKGSGRERTRVTFKEGTSGLMYAADGIFAVADISLEYSGVQPANVVTIQTGQVDFQRCRFTGGKGGQSVRTVGNGLQLRGRASGTIADCEFIGNGLNGLSIDEQAQPTISGCVVQNNQAAGIVYSGYSAGTVQNTNCSQNQAHGIQVLEQARPILEGGVCANNQRSGISVSGTSTGVAKNYRCLDNRNNGITVGDRRSQRWKATSARQIKVLVYLTSIVHLVPHGRISVSPTIKQV